MAKKSKRSSGRRRPPTPAARASASLPASAGVAGAAAPTVAGPAPGPSGEAGDAASSGLADAAAGPPGAPAATAAAAPATPAALSSAATARRVGRVDPATRRPRPVAAATPAPELDAEDPAIPLARVPYTTGDLRRVAIIAGLMVLLILVATVLVTVLVK
jgi:hypothetical protein